MSSKTTFKRVALVAVAALSLGVLSVAPSSAANTVLTFGTGDAAGADNASGYAVAGAFNYATVNVASAAADYVLTTDSTFVGQGDANPAGVLSTDAKSLSMTDQSITPSLGVFNDYPDCTDAIFEAYFLSIFDSSWIVGNGYFGDSN